MMDISKGRYWDKPWSLGERHRDALRDIIKINRYMFVEDYEAVEKMQSIARTALD